MKSLSKTVFIIFLLTLLWLVLFKLSFDISTVLLDHQTRSLDLIPFTGHLREAIENFVIFIPFGLLLSINLKRFTFWQKLICISIFSIAIEIIQFILAIGITDITDVTTNTAGGLFGLMLYDLGKKYVNEEKLDRYIVVAGLILLVSLILFRTLFLRVRY